MRDGSFGSAVYIRSQLFRTFCLRMGMMLGNGDGLSMLQTLSIVAAFPFAFIMVAAMAAFVKALKKERNE